MASKRFFKTDLFALTHHLGNTDVTIADAEITSVQCKKDGSFGTLPLLSPIENQQTNGPYLLLIVHGRIPEGPNRVPHGRAYEVVFWRVVGGSSGPVYVPIAILPHGTYCKCGKAIFDDLQDAV